MSNLFKRCMRFGWSRRQTQGRSMLWSSSRRMRCLRKTRQVRIAYPITVHAVLCLCWVASACTGWTWCPRRIEFFLGRTTVLLVSRLQFFVLDHGISPWWRSDDDAHQVRYFLWGCNQVLHRWMCFGDRGRPQDGIHSSVIIMLALSFQFSWVGWNTIVILSPIISLCEFPRTLYNYY